MGGRERDLAWALARNRIECTMPLNGELGYGNTNNIGDDEQPLDAGPVPLF
jgi:hypothetical protein